MWCLYQQPDEVCECEVEKTVNMTYVMFISTTWWGLWVRSRKNRQHDICDVCGVEKTVNMTYVMFISTTWWVHIVHMWCITYLMAAVCVKLLVELWTRNWWSTHHKPSECFCVGLICMLMCDVNLYNSEVIIYICDDHICHRIFLNALCRRYKKWSLWAHKI